MSGPFWNNNPFPGSYQPFPGLFGNGVPSPPSSASSAAHASNAVEHDSFHQNEAHDSPDHGHKKPWYADFAKETLKTGLTVGASIVGGVFGGVPGAIAAGSIASGLATAIDQKISKGKIDWGSVGIDALLGTIPGGVGKAVVKTGDKMLAKFAGKTLAQNSIKRTLKRAALEGAADGALMGYAGGAAQQAYHHHQKTGRWAWGEANQEGLRSILPGLLGGVVAGGAFTAWARKLHQNREAKQYTASIQEPVPEYLKDLKPPKITLANRLSAMFLQKPSEDALLGNFRKVDDRLFRGAMPESGAAFHRLQNEYNVKTIIDLRGLETTKQSAIEFEKAWAQEKAIEHVWLPMDSTKAPTQETLQRLFLEVEKAKRAGGNVYVHCKHGIDRTGSVVAAYETSLGKTQAEVFEAMQSNGYNRWHVRSRPEQKAFVLGDEMPEMVYKAQCGVLAGLDAERLLAKNCISKSEFEQISTWLNAGQIREAETLLAQKIPDRPFIFKEQWVPENAHGDQFIKTPTA